MSKFYLTIFVVFMIFGCKPSTDLVEQEDLTQYVNPFIGTGGHGHTYPGASMPFGMVQLSPDSRLEGWDGCGGYHYSDSIVYGFSPHTLKWNWRFRLWRHPIHANLRKPSNEQWI